MTKSKEQSSKRCFKCGADKPLSEFYRHHMMADGHVNKCKECNKRDVRENRAAKIDYYRAYDKKRFQEDPKVRERHLRYAATPEGKEALRKSKIFWAKRNPVKRAAHVILGNAVRNGTIEKPCKCQRCGLIPENKRHIHAHHHDYAKPLDVQWICVWCHIEEHKEET
jgi:hypothetical protein